MAYEYMLINRLYSISWEKCSYFRQVYMISTVLPTRYSKGQIAQLLLFMTFQLSLPFLLKFPY